MTDIVIRNVSVFDSQRAVSIPGQTLILRGGSVDWSGPSADAPRLPLGSATEVDGTGRTALPGLLNSHVHLIGNADPADPFTEDLEWAVARAIVAARQTLETGVTGVRDCGSLNGLAVKVGAMIEQGLVPGPRILAAGQVITMTGGHCHFFGRQVDGPWAISQAVRAELHAGADFIKIMATGGVLTKGSSPEYIAFELSELEQAARITHNAGKRITSHAIGAAGVKNAIRAGIDTVEHACYIDEEVIDLAVERGTIIVPTLNAVEREVAHVAELPEWMHGKVGSLGEASEAGFKRLLEAGVKIAAGSDAGTPFNPHDDFPRELELMVRYGMTPSEALAAATRVSAENFGLSGSSGSLAVGYRADLLMVTGDPTSDIQAVRDVQLVVKDGEIVIDRLGVLPADR